MSKPASWRLAIALFASAAAGGATLTLFAQHAVAGERGGHATKIGRSGGSASSLTMGVGKSVIVDLPSDASEIFVANPKVANAVVRSSRKLYIIATGGGQTTIFAMDKAGRQIATIEISVGRDIGQLERIIRTAIPDSAIVAKTVNDTIILTGSVDSAGDAQKAMDIASGFVGGGTNSSKVINSLSIRGRDQVMLKVTIAEVQRQIIKQLGVSAISASGGWGSVNLDHPLSLNPVSPSNTAINLLRNSRTNPISSTLRAFERNGVSRILAEPTVTAISGETAKFIAGGELPVPTSQTCTGTSCTTGVSFKPYGVSLNFTPVVVSPGRILLRVATEVTEIDPTTVVAFQTANIPAMRTRKNETSVELASGASIATAGLIQNKSRQVINGLPGLMNLPVLGTLFRSRDYQREETELLIVVTPYIAKPSNEKQLVRPDEGFSDPTDPQSWLLGRVNRIYSTKSNPQLIQNFRGRVGFITD
ncbi:MAG: type II and III secretion system protein family protein [Beijerinckiaceae bacterium]